MTTLVPGLVLFAPVAGLLAYRADVRRELAEINAATAMRPATEAETNRAFALDDRHVATTAAAVVPGTAGGALVVAGAARMARVSLAALTLVLGCHAPEFGIFQEQ